MPLSRWSKRHEKTFGKKKEKWNGNFRLPPKPECYYTKIKGQCRWCGNTIVNEDGSINERKSWHKECATQYMIIYHSREQRAQVFRRDSGVCNHCGVSSGRWDVDHIKPLVEQKGISEDRIDWTYYSMENLQTLCKKCHKIKSKSEVHLRSNVKDKRLKSRGIGRYNHKKFIGDTGRYNINKFIEDK